MALFPGHLLQHLRIVAVFDGGLQLLVFQPLVADLPGQRIPLDLGCLYLAPQGPEER